MRLHRLRLHNPGSDNRECQVVITTSGPIIAVVLRATDTHYRVIARNNGTAQKAGRRQARGANGTPAECKANISGETEVVAVPPDLDTLTEIFSLAQMNF